MATIKAHGPVAGIEATRNLVLDPRATSAARWTGTFGTGGIGNETMVTGAADGPTLPDGTKATTYARYTWTTGNSGGSPAAGYSAIDPNPPGGFLAGLPFGAAIYVRPSVAVPTAFPYVSQQVGGADGANVNLAAGALPANTWTRLGGTSTFSVDCETINSHGVALSSFNMPTGGTLDVVASLVTPDTSTLVPYFDGASVGAHWLGTPNASISELDPVIEPALVLNYATRRASRNVVLEPLGSKYPTVFLREAQSKAGTLSLLFQGDAPSREAEEFLSSASRFTFSEPTVGETWDFVVTGAVTRTHQTATSYWIVDAEVREVEPL